jgi:hypothetical protein
MMQCLIPADALVCVMFYVYIVAPLVGIHNRSYHHCVHALGRLRLMAFASSSTGSSEMSSMALYNDIYSPAQLSPEGQSYMDVMMVPNEGIHNR